MHSCVYKDIKKQDVSLSANFGSSSSNTVNDENLVRFNSLAKPHRNQSGGNHMITL